MIGNDFSALEQSAKKDKIRKIIISKASELSPEIIDNIIENIDLEKQYTITSTRELKVLEKNSYREEFENEDYSCMVSFQTLYGDFVPGLIDLDGQIIPPVVGDGIVVFLKTIDINSEDNHVLQYILFIYNPIIKN